MRKETLRTPGGRPPGPVGGLCKTAKSAVLQTFVGRALVVFAMALAAGGAVAQTYPSKPIRVIVQTSAGSTSDVIARALGDRMAKGLGQPWLVENRTGASGLIGTEATARAPADGYTVMLASSTTIALPAMFPKMTVDIAKDLAPVGWISSSPNVLVITADRGVKSLAEMIDLARKTPNGLDYGTPSVGSTAHLLVEIFRRNANVPMTHVPFKGAQQAMAETLAGRVPITMAGVSNALAQVRAGKLVPLAVADTKRSPVFPNTPTFAELGHADVDMTFWIGLWATGNSPRPVIERLNRELNATLQAPEVVERLNQLGFEVVGGSEARFAELIARETPLYAKIIAAVGIKAE